MSLNSFVYSPESVAGLLLIYSPDSATGLPRFFASTGQSFLLVADFAGLACCSRRDSDLGFSFDVVGNFDDCSRFRFLCYFFYVCIFLKMNR
jgi:hypothetical protein